MSHASAPACRPVVAVATTFISIQVLRGVAALLVIATHALAALPQDPFGLALIARLRPLLAPLTVGVDLFFVISGFVMAATIDGNAPPSATQFLTNRAIRIYPLYWLATLAMLPSAAAGIGFAREINGLPDILLSATLLPQTGLIVIQGWTLIHELLFYGIVAATLLFRVQRHLGVVLTALLAIALVQSAIGLSVAHGYVLSVFLAEFLVGVLIFRHRRHVSAWLSGWRGVWLVLAGLALFVAIQSAIDAHPVSDATRVLRNIGPAALIVVGCIALEAPLAHRARQGTRAIGIGRILGDASYSLYLFHPAPLGAMGHIAHLTPWRQDGVLIAAMVGAVIVTVAYCVAVARLIERPMHAWLKRRLAAGRTPLRSAVPAE